MYLLCLRWPRTDSRSLDFNVVLTSDHTHEGSTSANSSLFSWNASCKIVCTRTQKMRMCMSAHCRHKLTSFARGESLRPRSELDAQTIKSMNSSMYTALKTTSLHVQSLIVVLSSFTVLSISSIPSTTFSSKASLSSNSLTCVLHADQSPADFRNCWVDIAHVHALQKL